MRPAWPRESFRGINLYTKDSIVSQQLNYVPFLLGGSVNGWFINDVAWAARRAFQERWFIDNNMIQVGDIDYDQ